MSIQSTSKNSAKVVQHNQDSNNNLILYTELNTDISVGQLVFVIGGSLDNTLLELTNIYANGYKVLFIDGNAITLDITTPEEIDISNTYLSITSMLSGEFNGGNFNGGSVGKYNTDSVLFNNKDTSAQFNNGIFIGGDFLQGDAVYKTSNKSGTRTNSDLSVTNFVDDNSFRGYSQFVTGNIAKIYDSISDKDINRSENNQAVVDNNGKITFTFLPKPLLDFQKLRICVNGVLNNKIYDVLSVNITDKSVIVKPNTYTEKYLEDYNLEVPNTFTDIFYAETINDVNIEIYSNDVKVETNTLQQTKIYGGIYEKVDINGGYVYDGTVSESNVYSKKELMNWNGGTLKTSNVSNIDFNGGILSKSIWNDNLYSVTGIKNIDGKLAISINKDYKDIIDISKPLFVSYARDTVNYVLPMYDENPIKKELLNYREHTITKQGEYFVLDFDYIDINYQTMKVSQTNFNSGIAESNTVLSGKLKGYNYVVTNPIFVQGSNVLTLSIQSGISKFKVNDIVELSNIIVVYKLTITEGSENITTKYMNSNLNGSCRILSINNNDNLLVLELPQTSKDITENQEEGVIDRIIFDSDKDILITKNMWLSGDISNGYIDHKIMRTVNLVNSSRKKTDRNLISNETYYKKVTADNAVFTSDTIITGITDNSYVTNNVGGVIIGDTIVENLYNSSDISRGLIKNIVMGGGRVINAYIDKSVWNGGSYLNGFGLYKKDINRSGKPIDDKGNYEPMSMSAPSVVYVNKNKIQLSEPSTYQKNYKIIFKDFDLFGQNELDKNVFTIRDRNDLSDVLYIDEIENTFLCVNNISNYEIYDEIDYYLVDKTYNRLFHYHTGVDKTVETYSLDKINDISLDSDTNTLYIASNKNIYSLKNNVLKIYKTFENEIICIKYINNEIFVVDAKNIAYYGISSIFLTSNIIDKTTVSLTPNTSNLYLYYTSKNTVHRILMNITSSISFQNDILVYSGIYDITSVSSNSITDGMSLFITADNMCFRIDDNFVSGSSITTEKLNFSDKVFMAKPYNNKLYSIIDYNKNSTPCVMVSSELDNIITGFQSKNSPIKAEDPFNASNFYYYDALSNRIVYMGDGIYVEDNVVDTTGFTVLEIVAGQNQAYALMISNKEYYIGKIILNNGASFETVKIVGTNNTKISKLFLNGSLYFVYGDKTICRFSFTPTNISMVSIPKHIVTGANFIITDYFVDISNTIYYIAYYMNVFYLAKNTFTDGSVPLVSLFDTTDVLKSLFVKDEYVYILNADGIVKINSYITTDYELNKNMRIQSGNFDSIRYYNEEYYTINYSGYRVKRAGYIPTTYSNNPTSFVVYEKDDNELIVLSENRILYNDKTNSLNNILISGRYKEIREDISIIATPNLSDPIVKESVLKSSLNPLNPMTNVSKILYGYTDLLGGDICGRIYFAEKNCFFRLTVKLYDADNLPTEYQDSVDLGDNIRYLAETSDYYKTMFYLDINNNKIISKELIFQTDSDIVDISQKGNSEIIMFTTSGKLYIHSLINSHPSDEYISSIDDHLISVNPLTPFINIFGGKSNTNKFYVVNTEGVISYISYTTLVPFVVTTTIDSTQNVVLNIGENIVNVGIGGNVNGVSGLNDDGDVVFIVTTNLRTFYVNILNTFELPNNNMTVEYPFIINNTQLVKPIFSFYNDSDYIYLLDGKTMYHVNMDVKNIEIYDVEYLEKSPLNKNVVFMLIDNSYVIKQIKPSTNSRSNVIDVSKKIDITGVIKLVAISDDICYALTNIGEMYMLDFTTSSSVEIVFNKQQLLYRTSSPVVAYVDSVKYTDICRYRSSSNSYKILSNIEFLLNGDTIYINDLYFINIDGSSDKNGLDYVYVYESSSPIDTTLRYPMFSDGSVESALYTDLLYIYRSVSTESIKIYADHYTSSDGTVSDTITLCIESNDFIRKQNNISSTFICSIVNYDYYLLNIPVYDNTLASTTDGYIYPIDISDNATPIAFTTTNIVPDGMDLTLENDQILMVVDNTESVIYDNNNTRVVLNSSLMSNPNTGNRFIVTDKNGIVYSGYDYVTDTVNLLIDKTGLTPNNYAPVNKNTVHGGVIIQNTLPEYYILPYNIIVSEENISAYLLLSEILNNILLLNIILPDYSNKYIVSEIIRLYKTIYNIATPYVSARIINDSIINNGSDINSSGTSKTLYFMNSTWNNGLFTGSWNEPVNIDNVPVSSTSFFVNGSFNGEFHKGFFLGGSMLSGSIIRNGHFIANTNNIEINSDISNIFRYDIISMRTDSNKMRLNIETINTTDYSLVPTVLNPGTIITLPKIFKSNKFNVAEITDLKLNVDGKKSVLFSIPSATDISNYFDINTPILVFSKVRVSELNNYFEITDIKYSTTDKTLYLIVTTNISINNKLNLNNEVYISVNEYFRLSKDNDGYYIDAKTTDLLPYIKIRETDILIHTNNFKQLFTTSFSSGFYDLIVNTSNDTHNVYMNSVKYNGINIYDSVIEKSNIISSNIIQSIIYSGNIKSDMRMSHIMCIDDNGYLVDTSKTNIEGTFYGENINITNYGLDTRNDRIIITTDGALNDISKYRFVAIRGFSGVDSLYLGANYSVVHRIEEVGDNIIHIANRITDPTLDVVTQDMKIRDLSGQNLRSNGADVKQLYDYTFKTDISLYDEKQTIKSWFTSPLLDGTADVLLVENGYEITGSTDEYVSLIQELDIVENPLFLEKPYWRKCQITSINSDITLKFDFLDTDFNTLLNEKWDGSYDTISFPSNEKSIKYFVVKITKTNNNASYLEKLFLEHVPIIPFFETKTFNYCVASNSSVNLVDNTFGGEMYGVWNSGKFVSGDFYGKWFGSSPYETIYGTFEILDKTLILVDKKNKNIHIKFQDINIDGELQKVFESVYKTTDNDGFVDLSDIINLKDGSYDLTIYLLDSSDVVFGDISPQILDTTTFLDIPNSKNGMLISNYLTKACSIDLKFDKSISSDKSPVLSFINNETMLGVRLYYSKIEGNLVYVDELGNVNTSTSIETDYFKLGIINNPTYYTITYIPKTGIGVLDFDLNYIGKSVFVVNNTYVYSLYESKIENIKIYDGVKKITDFDFVYNNKYVSGNYIYEDDKTYAFAGLGGSNSFEVCEYSKINPIIDFEMLCESEGNIINFTNTISIPTIGSGGEETIYDKNFSISVVSVKEDGLHYRLKIVEKYNTSSSITGVLTNVLLISEPLLFNDKKHIVLTSDSLYLDGVFLGEFICMNRNIIQYTDKTNVILGSINFIEAKTGFGGYITNINIWENRDSNDVYDIYLTDVLPKTDLSINRKTPYYSISDNFKTETSSDKSIINDVYTNLNGDWTKISLNPLYTKIFGSYATTEKTDLIKPIILSNMKNFEFCGRKYVTDSKNNLTLHITHNGYIFFDKYNQTYNNTDVNLINPITLPIKSFASSDKDIVSSFDYMDAIVCNTFVTQGDSNTNYSYNLLDTNNYAIIAFYVGVVEYYRVYIDKKTSCIAINIKKVPASAGQKLFGLIRKDGTKMFIEDSKFVFEKYNDNKVEINNVETNVDMIYNGVPTGVNDKSIKNEIIVSFQPQFYQTNNFDESQIANKLFVKDFYGLKEISDISFYGTSYDYDYTKYENNPSYKTVNSIKYIPNNFSSGELYEPNQTQVTQPKMSYFIDGNYKASEWYNGVLVSGTIEKDNFIWKTGLKLNGTIKSKTDKLSCYTHWLGGFCNGDNDIADFRNTVWYRGKHSGGKFSKGYIFSYDYVLVIENNYTLFDRMVIYSNITKTPKTIYTNLYTVDKKIQVIPNTEYELIAEIADVDQDVDLANIFTLLGVNELKNVRYESNGEKYFTEVGGLEKESPTNGGSIVSYRFNSLNNTHITITLPPLTNAKNYKLLGYKTVSPVLDTTLLESFDTVWTAGKVVNKNRNLNYTSPYTKTYNLSDRTITLPSVDTTILGGLWLSGVFDGGIIANVFWNSVDTTETEFAANKFQKHIRHPYDIVKSIFKTGKMINSVWNGGKVVNDKDKQDAVLGDIINNYQIVKTGEDFKTPNNFVGFVKSTLPSAYKTVLGKKIFTGYYLTDNSILSDEQIVYNRVTTQNNTDGVSAVYVYRGDFENCIIQHSLMKSTNLNDDIVYNDNNFNINIEDCWTYMTQLNGVKFNTSATSDVVSQLHLSTPTNMVYFSEWNYGIWNVTTGIDSDVDKNSLITDALISRSVWNSGVFYGGTINNSIWRSGTAINITYHFENRAIYTIPSTNSISLNVHDGMDGVREVYDDDISLINDSNFTINMTKTRYKGGVDNFASIFVNGRMNGCVWHGGVFMRGMFTDKTYVNPNKAFNTIDEPVNTSIQKAVFCRGIIMGGYFGKYINDSKDISTYILSYNSSLMTDNNTMLGTNVLVYDTFSTTILRRNIRTNDYKTGLVDTRDYPYFTIINCLVSGGYLYNDTTQPNIDSVLFNTYCRVGDSYMGVQPSRFVFDNTSNNQIVINPIDIYVPNGGVNIVPKAGDINWRHNMFDLDQTCNLYTDYYYYSDNTHLETSNGFSLAQGDGTLLLDNYGEPRYNNQNIHVSNIQFSGTDFLSGDFKV